MGLLGQACASASELAAQLRAIAAMRSAVVDHDGVSPRHATSISTSRGASVAASAWVSASRNSLGALDAHALHALPRRERDEVEVGQVGAGHRRARRIAEHRREVLQRGITPVLQDHERDRQLELRRAPQRLDRVHRRAVTDQRNHTRARLGQRHADGGGQPPAEAAAVHRVEGFGAQDRQVRLHHRPRTRRFLDDDAVGRAQVGQCLQCERDRHALALFRRCGAGDRLARRRQRAWLRRGPCEQILQTEANAADHRQPLRCPGRGGRVVDQLHQRRAVGHMRARALRRGT